MSTTRSHSGDTTMAELLTPERLAFLRKHGGMALPDVEINTSIGRVTLSIIAKPEGDTPFWIKP